MKDLDESGTCGDLCKKASSDLESFVTQNGDALAAAVASGNDQESIEKALCEEQLNVCPADSSAMIAAKFKELEQKSGGDQDAAPASPTSRKLLAGLSFNGNVGLSAGLTGTQFSNGQSQAVNMPGSMSNDKLKTLGGILNPWAPRFAPTPASKPFGGWFFGGR